MRFITVAAPLFALQHGAATRRQLLAAGVSERQIDHAVAVGHLSVVHRGVLLQAGRTLDATGAAHAAVLSVPGSIACGWSAGHLHRLRDCAHPVVPEVLTAHSDTPEVPGVRVRRSRRLHDADRTSVDGVPAASVARTIVDLSARLNPARLESVVHQVLHTKAAELVDLWDGVVRLQPRSGIRSLIGVLVAVGGHDRAAESALEVRLLRLLRRAGIDGLQIQHAVVLDGYGKARFDAAVPGCRVAIEADHSYWHGAPSRRAADLRRDQSAERAGWQTLRFDEVMIDTRPSDVVAITLEALTARGYATPHPVGSDVPRAS